MLTEEIFDSYNTLDDPAMRRSRRAGHQNIASYNVTRVVSPSSYSYTKPDQIGQNSAIRHNFDRHENIYAGSVSNTRTAHSTLSTYNPLNQIYKSKNFPIYYLQNSNFRFQK